LQGWSKHYKTIEPNTKISPSKNKKTILNNFVSNRIFWLQVKGTIPKYVSGALHRQAGGAFQKGLEGEFNGLAHMARYELHGHRNKATFTNKFINSGAFEWWQETGNRWWDRSAGT
jgi:carotenoid cleavage dioxygenase-like enzyme